jgi:hypothetical protein
MIREPNAARIPWRQKTSRSRGDSILQPCPYIHFDIAY